MTTSDLDILIHTLNLLLRPAQQYSAQPNVSTALGLNTSRLSSLVKRWPNLHDFDLPLTSLCSGGDKSKVDELKNEAREVVFKFYKKDGSQSDKEKEKSSTAVADEDIFTAPPPPQTPPAPAPPPAPPTSRISSRARRRRRSRRGRRRRRKRRH